MRKWARDKVTKRSTFLDKHGSAIVTLLLALGTQWAAGQKQEQKIDQSNRWNAERRIRLSAKVDSLSARMVRDSVSIVKLQRRVQRLERAKGRGTDAQAASLAPMYDADEYGPQRPDPGLRASLGRLFTFWRHNGR